MGFFFLGHVSFLIVNLETFLARILLWTTGYKKGPKCFPLLPRMLMSGSVKPDIWLPHLPAMIPRMLEADGGLQVRVEDCTDHRYHGPQSMNSSRPSPHRGPDDTCLWSVTREEPRFQENQIFYDRRSSLLFALEEDTNFIFQGSVLYKHPWKDSPGPKQPVCLLTRSTETPETQRELCPST